MSNQFTSIRLRGVERHKAPTLADDGGASFCHNLRPAVSGLEIVKNKPLVYRIEGAVVTAAVNADGRAEITTVYRHRALPKGHYLVVLNKREVTLWKEADGDGTELEQVSGEAANRHNGGYPARYDEDIIALSELNNVLVIRTQTHQDYFLWNDGAYSYMPAIAAPKYTVLSQDFSFDNSSADSNAVARQRGRGFFQAVIGFKMKPAKEKGDTGNDKTRNFLEEYRNSLNSCLQFVQGIRAEDEANNRKAGRFVGHVLVRTAFKTAKGNYISYGQVMHAEIGAWDSNQRVSNFYNSNQEEVSVNTPWYQKLYGKIFDDNKGADDMLIDDRSNPHAGFYPISQIPLDENGDVPKFSVYLDQLQLSCYCGHSQLPVFVGTFPRKLWLNNGLRGDVYLPNNNYKAYAGIVQTDANEKDKVKTMPVGVYAPSIYYSYPILKIFIGNGWQDDVLKLTDLEYYANNNIIESLCVAMTAPVKHGYGTQLYRNGTVRKAGWWKNLDNIYDPTGTDQAQDLGNEYKDKTDDDILDIYGYARNIDANPDRLMGQNFYIVKDIKIKDIVKDINIAKDGHKDTENVESVSGGWWYTIPIQLKSVGAVERIGDNGETVVEVSNEEVDFSQEELSDIDRVSLENIELAKPLPTDNFTAHTVMGKRLFDYNRRLHMFDTETILFSGDSQSPQYVYPSGGYGQTATRTINDREIYFEYEIHTDARTYLERTRITRYTYPNPLTGAGTAGDGRADKMILNDILVYPDYRCKKIRVVERIDDKWYLVDNAEFDCENSILNNIAYYANTSTDMTDLPDVVLHAPSAFRVVNYVENRDRDDTSSVYNKGARVYGKDALFYAEGGGVYYHIAKAIHAYKEDDTLIYKPIIIDLANVSSSPIERPDDIGDDVFVNEGNRVQVSETDDVFYYPAKNSYRVGTLDNEIVAVNSMYGQVTEQKFGMFPLYMFTKEGIFTLEQGTGDILYQNVSKINDDCLTSPRSLCNAGDMVAYVVKNGLKLIQGKSAMLVSEIVRGRPHPIVDVPGITTDDDFADEIQGAYLLWDEYHNDVLMLCPRGGETPPEAGHILWAYNTLAKTFYGRGDAINPQDGGMRDVGVVENAKNLAWGGNVKLMLTESLDKHALSLNIWDYNKADELTPGVGTTLRFAYVSNLYRLGMNGYKHMERLVMRAFGNVGSLKITLYGSLDGRRCYKIGESRDIKEVDDATLRRSPCSFVYFGFSIIGDAVKDNDADVKDIVLQISQIDIELRQKYAGKLR